MPTRFRSSVLVAAAATALVLASGTAASAGPRPDVIPLPNGFFPEGIAPGTGNTVYAGSLAGGDVVKADLRTGLVEKVVDVDDRIAVGLKYSQRTKQLFVAGGPTGQVYVYDATSGGEVAALSIPNAGFINDVTLTKDGAWFTDSQQPQLYFLPVGPGGSIGVPVTVALDGPAAEFVPGFNLNGIAATPDGSLLVVVNSAKGALYTVNPSTGQSQLIDLGGDSVASGDGILLDGKRLWVVQNSLNQVAEVRLAPNYRTGVLVSITTNDSFRIPTTVARQGNTLAVVNARFDVAPTPTTEYEIVTFRR